MKTNQASVEKKCKIVSVSHPTFNNEIGKIVIITKSWGIRYSPIKERRALLAPLVQKHVIYHPD